MDKLPIDPKQTTALTRFKALNYVEDQLRAGQTLADALRSASLLPWPDENGDYWAARSLEDWWYAHRKKGFPGLIPRPRADQGQSRVLSPELAAWVVEQVTHEPQTPVTVLYTLWQQQGKELPSLSSLSPFAPPGAGSASLARGPPGNRPHQSLRGPSCQ